MSDDGVDNCGNEKVGIGRLSYCVCGGSYCTLGRGSYGIVFRGKLLNTDPDCGIEVAVKRVDRFRNKFEEEILRKVENGHSNIIRYYATEKDANFL